jgi:23S rRNA (uracil1939-C5)-methyltransferase
MDPVRLDSGGPAETAPAVSSAPGVADATLTPALPAPGVADATLTPALPAPGAVRCRHFGACGGCARQDLEYGAQLARKDTELREILGALIPGLKPIVPSPSPWYYRNKMEFAFGFERKPSFEGTAPGESPPKAPLPATHNVTLGLRRRGRFYGVVNLTECFLMCEAVPAVLDAVREWAGRNGLPPYHLRRHDGFLRYVVMREGKRTRQLMVILVTAPPPDESGFAAMLNGLGSSLRERGVSSLLWAVTDRQADLAVGAIRQVVFGEPRFAEELAGAKFSLSPYAFFQPHVEQAERLILRARELLGTGHEMLLDLYCGVGGLTITLANCAKRTIGIELDPTAVSDASRNAVLNGMKNCQFVAEDSLTFVRRFSNYSFLADRWAVVLDPPRAGMHPKMPAQILRVAPPVVLYVSCNPKKLAEDLSVLGSAYRVEEAVPYDFFPHTPHVEVLAKLVRR